MQQTEVVDLQEKEKQEAKRIGRAASKRHATGRRTPILQYWFTASQRCENAKLGQPPALVPA